jgi:hypothetical protein
MVVLLLFLILIAICGGFCRMLGCLFRSVLCVLAIVLLFALLHHP